MLSSNLRRWAIAGAAIVALSGFVASRDRSPVSAPSAKWEYAVYREDQSSGPSWITDTTRVEGETVNALIRKLGGNGTAGQGSATLVVAVYAGAQGWELIQCGSAPLARECYFKRPKTR